MTDVGAVDSYGEIGRGELVKRLGRGFAGKEEGIEFTFRCVLLNTGGIVVKS